MMGYDIDIRLLENTVNTYLLVLNIENSSQKRPSWLDIEILIIQLKVSH
jgi:hypothetical protein